MSHSNTILIARNSIFPLWSPHGEGHRPTKTAHLILSNRNNVPRLFAYSTNLKKRFSLIYFPKSRSAQRKWQQWRTNVGFVNATYMHGVQSARVFLQGRGQNNIVKLSVPFEKRTASPQNALQRPPKKEESSKLMHNPAHTETHTRAPRRE